MMDVESSRRCPKPRRRRVADAPRDGRARGTDAHAATRRPAARCGAPAAAPPAPRAKRARTAATEGVKSFDGAKQFIAQLRGGARAPAEPHAEPHARDPARETVSPKPPRREPERASGPRLVLA